MTDYERWRISSFTVYPVSDEFEEDFGYPFSSIPSVCTLSQRVYILFTVRHVIIVDQSYRLCEVTCKRL